MRSKILFNDNWLFLPEDAAATTPDARFESVTLPHTNILLPHHNFDNMEYQFVSTYRKRFRLPEARDGRRVYIDFEGAMVVSTVYVNGQMVGINAGGFTPFSFDITDYVNETGENLLEVKLDSSERKDVPPFGYVVDYLTFGGIYRDVYLRMVEPVHMANDVFIYANDVMSDTPTLDITFTLKNQGDTGGKRQVGVWFDGQPCTLEQDSIAVQAGGDQNVHLHFNPPLSAPIQRWSPENPHLYTVEIRLFDGGKEVDIKRKRFGFREAIFREDGFYLNGEKINLRGLNRHQTYPYIGAAAPKRLQVKDADIVKYELGCNIVRTSHYPQSPHFIQRCDEIGLLVFEEIPGWQHIGDEDWQAITLRDVESMILRDRNHPSIVLWGVRVNESQDNEALYRRTNALAHELDHTRQTGGVRYIRESQFLEDVFTFNDFSNTVREPNHLPYLITEFNGHMFPTKSWDQEERLVEHALRHAKIQDLAIGTAGVSGAIGWCAFDYNTHKEFGSGDRICYHGVMDTFRLPKYAAYVYASQVSPSERVVLQTASLWTMGDRNGGGNSPLVVLSNCDEIDVFIGADKVGRFQPDRVAYPHLAHPPFVIDLNLASPWMIWGSELPDLRVVGYVNGTQATEHSIAADGLPAALTLEADDSELQADGADMTRLVFKIVDRFGNRLPYVNQVISFELDGPGELIGENPFALIGGQAALYVKATHTPGQVTIRASTPRLPVAEVTISMRAVSD